ncbi:Aspartyl/glutamyl-tRNA(Asn/Gln) amidotransferase subunit B [Usitatibacter rugosus]|uniref:Aspartyl/glutamyl-tRNA(Asn/Gln) amidotransferase subunit B n=1 Tax=Usitatibacter rugosus TaxID=2732067 RepID=A0A6M4H3C4_9PROT|nr:Asp-tRNA(Asn)/Glu-tRNA(Gln) amidotransferase subunit GatB [Usitatibacter rugosus]QJR13054.1 Aspartyl/glutamyl-tRNA(Asn/Gln) amidotransferase subunit B [Usitatibacter rugosus]
MKAGWEVVIGLETHAQLTTASKIFSGAATTFGAEPNTQASAVDIALPGTLPVLNKGAVERAIRFGLAVGGTIAPRCIFARKNYFYPDLPKGYQISQYEQPVVAGGTLAFLLDGEEKVVHLTRAHLEEDAGKLLHDAVPGTSGVDLNRAGTPLLEIVTEPDMRSSAEAVAYAKALHSLVRWIGICDGNMQEGSFRCDANVSVRKVGDPKLGTRCEIKNVNSFRFLEKAIEFEIRRQIEVIEDGGKIVQETRLYDADRDETRSMRSKEDAQDYRYFPDPDLLPLAIGADWIAEIESNLPPLPAERKRHYVEHYKLGAAEASFLTSSREMAEFFEESVSATLRTLEADVRFVDTRETGVARAVCNWLVGAMSAKLNETALTIDQSPVRPMAIAGLIHRVFDQTLSSRTAKDVFEVLWGPQGDPPTGGRVINVSVHEHANATDAVDAIVEMRGLKQISDSGAVEAAVDQVMAANPKLVEDFRSGKEKAFNALVGQVMKATQGKANPAQVNAILRAKLG